MPVFLDFGLIKRISDVNRLGLAQLVLGTARFGKALASNLPPAESGAKEAKEMVLNGFRELEFPIDDSDTGILLEIASFLFRPSMKADEAEKERSAKEAEQAGKVLRTANDKVRPAPSSLAVLQLLDGVQPCAQAR